MAAALTVLRKFNIEKREIKEGKENITFGDVSWPKNLMTNYIVWGTGKDGITKDYYTLDCLLFFLKSANLSHPQYVRKAAAENLMVVRRPDRKDLLAFLGGETDGSQLGSIDTSLDFVEAVVPIKRGYTDLADTKNSIPSYLSKIEDQTESISKTLSSDRIASIKEKIRRKKHDFAEFERGVVGVDVIRDAVYRERVWTNRNIILRKTKPLWEGVRKILQSLKSRKHNPPVEKVPVSKSWSHGGSNYNRYDQERFYSSNDTGGFRIDKAGTFSRVSGTDQSIPQVATKKKQRTPIIVIPACESALINMYNVNECLINMRYIPTEEVKRSGTVRSSEVLLLRKCANSGRLLKYRVVDSVIKLLDEDWANLVAVFVQGPGWQFKGWPWRGTPSEIFAHVKAFHLKFKELPAHENIGKWSVSVLSLDQERRHDDKAVFTHFWNILDQYMECERPYYSRT